MVKQIINISIILGHENPTHLICTLIWTINIDILYIDQFLMLTEDIIKHYKGFEN